MYGFHDFETATKLAELITNETGKSHCVLNAEDVDGPGGMFTLGVKPQSAEISADVYGFHDFGTATKLAELITNETGKPHCVLNAEDVDGPGGMFTLGVKPRRNVSLAK